MHAHGGFSPAEIAPMFDSELGSGSSVHRSGMAFRFLLRLRGKPLSFPPELGRGSPLAHSLFDVCVCAGEGGEG